MGFLSATNFFSEAFGWFANLSSKLPQIDFRTFFIVVITLLIGVGAVVGLTFFGCYRFKLLLACRKIIRYLKGVEFIDDDNFGDFTAQCFSAKAPSVLRDCWVQYLGVRFGYPSDIVSEQNVYDSQIKRVREIRANIFVAIALILLAVFAFWGYGTLNSNDMGVIFLAGLLFTGAIYLVLVILNRLISKRCLETFSTMQEDLDAKVNLQVEKSFATDSSPLAELSAIIDEIVARNTAKELGFDLVDGITPIEELIACMPENEEKSDIADDEVDYINLPSEEANEEEFVESEAEEFADSNTVQDGIEDIEEDSSTVQDGIDDIDEDNYVDFEGEDELDDDIDGEYAETELANEPVEESIEDEVENVVDEPVNETEPETYVEEVEKRVEPAVDIEEENSVEDEAAEDEPEAVVDEPVNETEPETYAEEVEESVEPAVDVEEENFVDEEQIETENSVDSGPVEEMTEQTETDDEEQENSEDIEAEEYSYDAQEEDLIEESASPYEAPEAEQETDTVDEEAELQPEESDEEIEFEDETDETVTEEFAQPSSDEDMPQPLSDEETVYSAPEEEAATEDDTVSVTDEEYAQPVSEEEDAQSTTEEETAQPDSEEDIEQEDFTEAVEADNTDTDDTEGFNQPVEDDSETIAADVNEESEEPEEPEVRYVVDGPTEDEEIVKPARLVKLPNLVEYMLRQNLSKQVKIQLAMMLVSSYKKFEDSADDKAIIISCMKKLMFDLQTKK